jgi:hypothetical protein
MNIDQLVIDIYNGIREADSLDELFNVVDEIKDK